MENPDNDYRSGRHDRIPFATPIVLTIMVILWLGCAFKPEYFVPGILALILAAVIWILKVRRQHRGVQ